MDFGSALLLASMPFLLTELAAQVFTTMQGRVKVALAIVFAQAATWCVANSDWGSKQVVSGIRLDQMNGFSLVLVGIALAGLAVLGKQGLKAVANVGQNRSATP